MKKHYSEIKECRLTEIFPGEHFRLVDYEDIGVPHGISEIPVVIDLKKGFKGKLSFPISWDGELFGFVRNKREIYQNIGSDTGVKITINNWDNGFVLVFEDKDGKEGPVFKVSEKDIIDMLEKCMRPAKI